MSASSSRSPYTQVCLRKSLPRPIHTAGAPAADADPNELDEREQLSQEEEALAELIDAPDRGLRREVSCAACCVAQRVAEGPNGRSRNEHKDIWPILGNREPPPRCWQEDAPSASASEAASPSFSES